MRVAFAFLLATIGALVTWTSLLAQIRTARPAFDVTFVKVHDGSAPRNGRLAPKRVEPANVSPALTNEHEARARLRAGSSES